jgi:hypothetical protein
MSQKLHARKAPSPVGRPSPGFFGFVPQDELASDQQPLLDRPNRSLDARIRCRKKPDERHQQQACVEPVGAIGLHEAVKVAVETALTDFGMDFVGDRASVDPIR